LLAKRETNTVFQIINIQSECSIETEYTLDSLIPNDHRFGLNNCKLKFVGFAQAMPSCSESLTPDIFQVHFLVESGEVYSMCPVLPRTCVLSEQHFSQIDVLLSDQDSRSAHLLQKAFREGKTGAKQKPGFCFIELTPEKQRQLTPILVGPITIINRAELPAKYS
jgi:hypothetical protein